jgi:hypothetical protein
MSQLLKAATTERVAALAGKHNNKLGLSASADRAFAKLDPTHVLCILWVELFTARGTSTLPVQKGHKSQFHQI